MRQPIEMFGDEALGDASRPWILLDGVPPAFALLGWRANHPTSHPRFAEATVRTAELLRPIDSGSARKILGRADATDPRVAAVRCATWLDLGRADKAAQLVDRTVSPMRDLLRARIALQRGDRAHFRALLEGPDLPPDVRAEAWSFHAQSLPDSTSRASELQSLAVFCRDHAAPLTATWLETVGHAWAGDVQPRLLLASLALNLDRVRRDARAGVRAGPETLGPIPPEVHGILRRHRGDPGAGIGQLVVLGWLLWRKGHEALAFRVFVLGRRLVSRFFGEAWGAALEKHECALRTLLGEREWLAHLDALAAEEGEFLAQRRAMRPPQ
jgi:hypothetical protein